MWYAVPDLLTTRRSPSEGTWQGAPRAGDASHAVAEPYAAVGGTAGRARRPVALTDAQIEALVSAAELAEAAWWDDPTLHRRLAALARARRALIKGRRG